jgi:hypothetical protein
MVERGGHTRQFNGVADESGYDPSRMAGEALFMTPQRLLREEEAAARQAPAPSGIPADAVLT